VRQFVGVARQMKVMERLRERRREREQAVDKVRGQLKDAIAAVAKDVDAADAAVAAAEAQVNPLGKQVRGMSTPAILELADKVEPVVRASSSTAAAARRAVEGIADGFEASLRDDLRAILQEDPAARQIDMQTLRLAPRVSRVENLLDRFRRDAELKERRRAEDLKRAALTVLRYHQQVKGLSREELFASLDTDKNGWIDEREFVRFFKRADKEVKVRTVRRPAKATDAEAKAAEAKAAEAKAGEAKAAEAKAGEAKAGEAKAGEVKDGGSKAGDAKEGESDEPPADEDLIEESDALKLPTLDDDSVRLAFSMLLPAGEKRLSKKAFVKVVLLTYVVVVRTTLADRVVFEGQKTQGILEESDVLEVLEGPVREGDADAMRVKVRCVKDGAEGWATIQGGKGGSVFLREGGNVFRVAIPAPISTSLVPPADEAECRTLEVGEVVDVEEGPTKEETSGHTRIQVKVRSDGSTGWVTARSGQGALFCRAVW